MTIPQTMYAVLMTDFGEASQVLHYERAAVPQLAPEDVLLRVHAIGVNQRDIYVRQGLSALNREAPHILGSDVAGKIAAKGDDVSGWKVGQRVTASFRALGSERDGSYADYVTVPAELLHQIPKEMDYETAAAVGLPFKMAWMTLHGNSPVTKDDQIVVKAAHSAHATAILQLANNIGAKTIAIAHTTHHAALLALGASVVVDENFLDPAEAVRLATDDEGASVVVDLIGHGSLRESVEMLRYGGRVLVADTLAGEFAVVDLHALMTKNAQIIGISGVPQAKTYDDLLAQVAKGELRAPLQGVMPLSQAADAHTLIEANETVGKIVLVPDSLTPKPGRIPVEIE